MSPTAVLPPPPPVPGFVLVPPAPPGFDARLALQTLGYSLADADAAARAFRRHWAGDEATAELTDADKAMLYCLVERKAGG